MRRQDAIQKYSAPTNHQYDNRKINDGARKTLRRRVTQLMDGQPCQELHRRKERVCNLPHACDSLTPADSNVAISFSTFAEASMIDIATAAPVPSPSRMPRFRSGLRAMKPRSAECPGSVDTCPANMKSLTFGSIAKATAPAAVEMNPSRTTGIRRLAAPRIHPVSPAISKPPTLRSTSIVSSRSGELTESACSIARTFQRNPDSSTPVT